MHSCHLTVGETDEVDRLRRRLGEAVLLVDLAVDIVPAGRIAADRHCGIISILVPFIIDNWG